MRLGIFAKIFVRPTLAETLDAVGAHGLDCVQFNFACAGLPTLPEKISPDLIAKITAELRKRKLTVAAVSGTFNIINPDKSRREAGFRGLRELAANCTGLGTSIITLCGGTRDPGDMWRSHPDNDSPEAWREMLQSIVVALEIADKYKIFLGIEPEAANVISSAQKARQLLDEMKSPRLKIVIDASNLFHSGDGMKAEDVLNEAFDLLGRDIGLAHAKDYRDAGKMDFVAPGKGDLPWAQYFRLLRASGFGGPLIMHSLAETEVDGSVSFLRKKMLESEKPRYLPIASVFDYDEIAFNYKDAGRGIPFFYQHGLTGSVEQTFGLFNPPAGFRMISFDCRCHGETRPAGPDEKINIASFADDLLALMNHLKIGRAIVGGISMGAALSLNFALRYPNRVRALILQRPAWLDGPPRENVEVFTTMAQLIRQHGALKGLELFKETPTYQSILKDSPAAADSLAGYFQHPRAEETVAILERIPIDTPHPDRAKWRAINVPTLVLANKQDPIHPFEFGEVLAREIPGAEFRELTPKSVSLERHNEEAQQFIEDFLLRNF